MPITVNYCECNFKTLNLTNLDKADQNIEDSD